MSDASRGFTKMRDLVFKNITSDDKRKRILQAQEVISDNGMLTKIRRGFVYLIKPVKQAKGKVEQPEVCIIKSIDTKLKIEKLFLKIKGGLYAVNKGQLYFLSFCHSLRVDIQKDMAG